MNTLSLLKKEKFSLATSLFLSLIASLVLTEIVLYSANTIYLQSDWNVLKNESEINLMGDYEFITARSTLSQNQLNLGKWYGHNYLYRLDSPARNQFKVRPPISIGHH